MLGEIVVAKSVWHRSVDIFTGTMQIVLAVSAMNLCADTVICAVAAWCHTKTLWFRHPLKKRV